MSIKSIKEKQLLVNLAKSFGQGADPALLAAVEEHRKFESGIRSSIRSNVLEDLNKALLELKQQADRVSVENNYPLPPSLDDLENILGEEDDLDKKETEEVSESIASASTETSDRKEKPDPSITDLVSHAISKSIKVESFQQPDPLLVDADISAIQRKLRFLEQWLGKISVHGPGGGAGSVAKLDHETKLITNPSYNITSKDYYIGVNYSGRANLYLPAAMPTGRVFVVKDELGEASRGTNRHIYIYPPEGELIDKQNYAILAYDFGSLTFIKRVGFWSVI